MERELEQLEGTVEDIIYQNEDNGYTVFGEVEEGLDVVDAIQNVDTDRADRPTEDIAMTITRID